MGQEELLVIIRVSCLLVFKIYSVTNEQHTVYQNIPYCPQASAAIWFMDCGLNRDLGYYQNTVLLWLMEL